MLFYDVTSHTASLTGDFDVIELIAPKNGSIVLHRIVLSHAADVGPTKELRVQAIRGFTTSGSGGQPPANGLDPAATFTVSLLNPIPASGGTPIPLPAENWNIEDHFDTASPLNPLNLLMPLDKGLTLRDGERLAIRISAPTTTITVRVVADIEQT